MKHLKKFENHPGLTDYAYNMRMGEVDEKNYEATDDNPVVQEFLKDLKNYYDQHHDDLYDEKFHTCSWTFKRSS